MLEIRNATLPDSTQTTIVIRGSEIISLQPTEKANQIINVFGLICLPGAIDPHVHFRCPGGEHKEDWETGSSAAAKGGITTVFEMPNTSPATTTLELFGQKKELADTSEINSLLWLGATADNAKEIELVAGDRNLRHQQAGVKIYMGSSTGDLLVSEDEDIRNIFKICSNLGLVAAVHAEDENLMKRNRTNLHREPRVSDHCQIRSTEVEVSAVKRALKLAKITGVKLYLCHLSTPEAVELAILAKDQGQTVYIEVCPHHLIFTSDYLATCQGAYYKMNPPLRSKNQVERLRQLVFEGLVDTIGSDHAPHTHHEKQQGKYDDVPSGVPGVETLLPIMFDFVTQDRMTLKRLVELTSQNAAQIFGLRKGQIKVGYDADLILFDPKRYLLLNDPEVKSKCGWTPYAGMVFRGLPTLTIANGQIVYDGRNTP